MSQYPYPDGDALVLGPEVFVGADEQAICWKGVNFIREDVLEDSERVRRQLAEACRIAEKERRLHGPMSAEHHDALDVLYIALAASDALDGETA